ncbi:hypothetical protein Pint_32133 [Pistacia integerrima]|uniref:Uncharacterized protein n=1 Tax=Pistacia integerrima TaxID=434235 RepID=A0ACC0XN14_9ROSI|nr:hypothetical protein Pint_32133 [Pistacia integerrima]
MEGWEDTIIQYQKLNSSFIFNREKLSSIWSNWSRLCKFIMEDLKRATKNFGEDTKIGDQSFKGKIDNVEVMIKQMRFEDTRQIAFDIATGLHYLHHCIFPTYAHMSVNTRNIFITSTWRAKLASIETNHAAGSSKGNDISASAKGWIAPEYLLNGSVSEKEEKTWMENYSRSALDFWEGEVVKVVVLNN